MKKVKITGIAVLFGFVSVFVACSSDDSVSPETKIKQFVWLAMNQFYYWQSEVPELSDSNAPSFPVLNAFLNAFDTPESMFDELKHPDDRFSWIVDDYEELEASFQGISKSFGYDLQLLRISNGSDDLMVAITYVVAGGPAEAAGLERGDVFTKVDNTQLTVDNFVSLLFEQESYTITLAAIQDKSVIQTDQKVALTAVELVENPIFRASVLDVEGVKVGYLMYNQFINNNAYHNELNSVFGSFQSEGINDLVLDLRYNGGGSLTTARILASMIYGNATGSTVLGSIIYNEKLAEFNSDLSFVSVVPEFDSDGNQTSSSQMNRLSLSRIFILTGEGTASASELIIAGLLPYMDVTLIGTTTVGKNVGSVTLYDSDDYQKSETLNPNHTYAIQPIISQIANSVGFTDYIDGFSPDIEVNEVDYLENWMPLGDPAEPLLAEALAIITGNARIERLPDSGRRPLSYSDSKPNMIIMDHAELPELRKTLAEEVFQN